MRQTKHRRISSGANSCCRTSTSATHPLQSDHAAPDLPTFSTMTPQQRRQRRRFRDVQESVGPALMESRDGA